VSRFEDCRAVESFRGDGCCKRKPQAALPSPGVGLTALCAQGAAGSD